MPIRIIIFQSLKNFAVYKSGAGSGKTFTLVREYLRLALQHPKSVGFEFKRINAITFTNKAAAEMKWRILKALQELSHGNPKSETLSKLLQSDLKTGSEEIKENAGILLSSILHSYSDFSVGTIDSFTHKIVKTFAFDLQLPLNFNLETDTKPFFNKVVYQLLNQIGQDKQLTEWLSEYALNKVEEDESWDPEKHLREFTQLLQSEAGEKHITRLSALSANDLLGEKEKMLVFMRNFRSDIKTLAQPVMDFISKYQLQDDDFTYTSSGPQRFFYRCLEDDLYKKKEDIIGKRLSNAIEKKSWSGKSSTKKDIIDANETLLSSTAKKIIDFLNEKHSDYVLFHLLQKQMYAILLLKKMQEITERLKQEEQTVFLSEFNQRISELVRTEPTPFIYERMGERYHHFLLDEFQDTGELQWQNMLPLIDNALAAAYYSLVVGDGKQSIYRWRNANVEQFANLPFIKNSDENLLLKEREASLIRNYLPNTLDKNFRSSKTVIDFNNTVFDTLSKIYLLDKNKRIYEAQAQIPHSQETGYVTLFKKESESDEKDDFTLQQIETHIREALEDGFQYRDICIITRFNRHGNTVATHLSHLGIPVVSNDSLLLYTIPEVNVATSILLYLCDTEDSISAAFVLHYLYSEGRIDLNTYHRALVDVSRSKNLFIVLSEFGISFKENSLRLSNLFDCVYTIVHTLQLHQKNDMALRFFMDMVNEFLVTQSSNLVAFIDWWEKRKEKASLIVPDNADAVKIMSIHAAKGLEFPVVIAPYCNWSLYKYNNDWIEINNPNTLLTSGVVKIGSSLEQAGLAEIFEAEKEMQNLDNLNLLYVQFTRAVHRLHIISVHTKVIKNTVCEWLAEALKYASPQHNEDDFFIWGQRSNEIKPHNKETLPPFKLNSLHTNVQSDIIKIKGAFQSEVNSEKIAAQEKGVLWHGLLADIKTTNDIIPATQKALWNGLINETELSEIQTHIQQLIHHTELQAYFKEGIVIKTEAEILTASGAILRPDRLILENDTITIIDYKTGERADDKYAKQLQLYADACMALGYRSVKKILVYLQGLEILVLD
jgi:ATP-dependent exoDNAse (exonuclease V) beta subunit